MRGINKEQKILIADDSEMNRSILADILGDEYEIIEAENGVEAVAAIEKYGVELSVVLLDFVMPEMDGFGVLAVMQKNHWIEDIPVIMISAETGTSYVERAYELGVTDFITRPFDVLVVHRRVVNTILLYAKQKNLISLVTEQIYENERQSNMMIDILSHIVEFRNGESGLHVRHVHLLTDRLLQRLVQKTDKYSLTQAEIALITTASGLHDIGKISIDEKILNKPGRLTDEEFEIMKTHSAIGARIIESLPRYQQQPLVKFAYQICRWHHERYDGRGYPDGLKGEEIPIAAQIVAVADVYDALTSERVYKKALPHETAVRMILDGKCGVFNPLVLECLLDEAEEIREELLDDNSDRESQREMNNIVRKMLRHEELSASGRTLQLLEHERIKYDFFAAMTQEIQFEYTVYPPMVTLNPWGARRLGIEEIIMEPHTNPKALALLNAEGQAVLTKALQSTTPNKPMVTRDCRIRINNEERWFRITARATWSAEEPPRYLGAIGKAIDVHDSCLRLNELEQAASHDALTGLLNHASARKMIIEQLKSEPHSGYALVIFDLDHFKMANDTYGHMFGDKVLKYMAKKLTKSVRSGDIAARVGGDEFLIFLRYETALRSIIERIFSALIGQYEDFTISVSMGVARTEVVGNNYEDLFHAADQALYKVKRSGRGQFQFYNDTMNEMLSVISPIDGSEDAPDGGTE